MTDNPSCPQCGGATKKNGKRKGRQQYKCKTCPKQFIENPNPVGRPTIKGQPLTPAERYQRWKDKQNPEALKEAARLRQQKHRKNKGEQ